MLLEPHACELLQVLVISYPLSKTIFVVNTFVTVNYEHIWAYHLMVMPLSVAREIGNSSGSTLVVSIVVLRALLRAICALVCLAIYQISSQIRDHAHQSPCHLHSDRFLPSNVRVGRRVKRKFLQLLNE